MSDNSGTTADLMTPHVEETGGLISALRKVQQRLGHIPKDAIAIAADLFNLSQAEVRGVVSFYEDFREKPVGETVIRICQAEACQAVGSAACTKQASSTLDVALGETREDGAVSLLPVYCLGLCASGPAIMVDGQPLGRAEGDRLDALLSSIVGGAGR